MFISHSANRVEEPVTQEFLDKLCGNLSQCDGIEVLVDQRSLDAGDEWCQRLFAWMGLCDAAIILLSPRAIRRENSTWVPREVNLLMWRKALDTNFTVTPVLVGGLRRSEISENPFVANSRLVDIHFAEGSTDEQKIDAIVQKIAEKARQTARRTAFDPIQIFVEDSISRFAPRLTLQTTLMKHYGGDPWQPFGELQVNLAIKMVKHSIGPEVDDVIVDVSRGSQPDYQLAARLFQALFPLRLPAEPSCRLLALCHQQAGRGAVVINCHDSWIVRMMLRAATGQLEDDLLRSWRVLELPDGWGDNDEEETTRFIAAELAEAILGTGGWDLLCEEPNPSEALALHLAEFSEESGVPILVCATFSPRWIELTSLLASKFPNVVFLLWSGRSLPDLTHSHADATPPEPLALPEGCDRHLNLGYRRKIQFFGCQA